MLEKLSAGGKQVVRAISIKKLAIFSRFLRVIWMFIGCNVNIMTHKLFLHCILIHTITEFGKFLRLSKIYYHSSRWIIKHVINEWLFNQLVKDCCFHCYNSSVVLKNNNKSNNNSNSNNSHNNDNSKNSNGNCLQNFCQFLIYWCGSMRCWWYYFSYFLCVYCVDNGKCRRCCCCRCCRRCKDIQNSK